ncbi:MAG: hypothetical protein AAF569_09310, partial [Pseudomonadota bacterium]
TIEQQAASQSSFDSMFINTLSFFKDPFIGNLDKRMMGSALKASQALEGYEAQRKAHHEKRVLDEIDLCLAFADVEARVEKLIPEAEQAKATITGQLRQRDGNLTEAVALITEMAEYPEHPRLLFKEFMRKRQFPEEPASLTEAFLLFAQQKIIKLIEKTGETEAGFCYDLKTLERAKRFSELELKA